MAVTLPMVIGTIGDLQDAIAGAEREQRIDVWYNDTGRILQAVGVSGENTDFSFYILDEAFPS